jgi:hypothetical protein
MAEGEVGPVMTWIRDYNANIMTLEELTERIGKHEFPERKGEAASPPVVTALQIDETDYEAGTFDDVYRAQGHGLLTATEVQAILDRRSKTTSEG